MQKMRKINFEKNAVSRETKRNNDRYMDGQTIHFS